MRQAVDLLRPFEEVPTELSAAEKNVSASKVCASRRTKKNLKFGHSKIVWGCVGGGEPNVEQHKGKISKT